MLGSQADTEVSGDFCAFVIGVRVSLLNHDSSLGTVCAYPGSALSGVEIAGVMK